MSKMKELLDQRLEENKCELFDSVKELLQELGEFKEDALCEHEVGVCWCSYWNAIDRAQTIIDRIQEVSNVG